MALPNILSNAGNPVVDAVPLMANFNYLDTGKVRAGQITSVAADGSSNVTLTISPALNSIVAIPMPGFSAYSGTDNAMIAARIVGTPTTTSVTWVVNGGQAGSTVTLHYRIEGT